MDHEKICDCMFKDECSAYADPLIDPVMKGPAGFGCTDRNDLYRQEHCKSFACKYFSAMFSDMLTPLKQGAGK